MEGGRKKNTISEGIEWKGCRKKKIKGGHSVKWKVSPIEYSEKRRDKACGRSADNKDILLSGVMNK